MYQMYTWEVPKNRNSQGLVLINHQIIKIIILNPIIILDVLKPFCRVSSGKNPHTGLGEVQLQLKSNTSCHR